jgi:pimeloyl-ACP methyl ester carboxylesterase
MSARTHEPEPGGPSFWSVKSADGTTLKVWTNGAEGPTVLLCNGLGTGPRAWPALFRRDCGVNVVSWYHRGVGGSERPRDRNRVGIDTLVEDAVAVLDDLGIGSCPVMGWSMGVNTAFELASQHPSRVSGLLAVGGVPGDTFASMLAPLRLPRPIRRPLTGGAAWLLAHTGWAISPVSTRLRLGPVSTILLQHSGFMLPGADKADVRATVEEFMATPLDWYMHLAARLVAHRRIPLSTIKVPAYFVAGKWDVLASAHDMRTAADRFEDSCYTELSASHFIQLEHPDEVHAKLLDLVARVSSEG